MAKRVSLKGKPKELDPFTKFLMDFQAISNKQPMNQIENELEKHNKLQENYRTKETQACQ